MAATTMTMSSAGRAFYVGSRALALGVGALQMYLVRSGFVTNCGADVVGTARLNAMFWRGTTVLQRGRRLSPEVTATVVLAGCAGSEFAQRSHVVPGVFDPLDLLAFGLSTLVCYSIDRGFEVRRQEHRIRHHDLT